MNKTTSALLILGLVPGFVSGQNLRSAAPRPLACTSGLQLPEGFCETLFADSVRGVRHIAIAPNGDVFVNVQGKSSPGILALRDTNRDGTA
ncbi:MAG TPA: hypothetical protein VJ865_09410, partial [Gemmatimonadaceae bacterium]|nr:hypothetical protein [Gemmatimonadaceae bacterium]